MTEIFFSFFNKSNPSSTIIFFQAKKRWERRRSGKAFICSANVVNCRKVNGRVPFFFFDKFSFQDFSCKDLKAPRVSAGWIKDVDF